MTKKIAFARRGQEDSAADSILNYTSRKRRSYLSAPGIKTVGAVFILTTKLVRLLSALRGDQVRLVYGPIS
jgi:hypothetical protein